MKKAVPMRSIVIAAAVALGLGLATASSVNAATAQGAAIGDAARATSPVTKVPCAMRRVCNRYGCRSVRRCW
jgi:hypothetical protein